MAESFYDKWKIVMTDMTDDIKEDYNINDSAGLFLLGVMRGAIFELDIDLILKCYDRLNLDR